MSKGSRKWYTKKRWLAALAFVFVLAIFPSEDTAQVSPRVESAVQETQSFVQSTEVNAAPQEFTEMTRAGAKSEAKTPGLSNDNYYTNTDGYKVHSPAYAPSVPAGASAMCRDGTYSFSMNRRGTCSHHGGVATWY